MTRFLRSLFQSITRLLPAQIEASRNLPSLIPADESQLACHAALLRHEWHRHEVPGSAGFFGLLEGTPRAAASGPAVDGKLPASAFRAYPFALVTRAAIVESNCWPLTAQETGRSQIGVGGQVARPVRVVSKVREHLRVYDWFAVI
jgi:hypothetical protein